MEITGSLVSGSNSAEFAKRNTRVTFRAVDEISYNELLDQKRAMIEQRLLADAERKMVMSMIEQGADMEDPEIQKIIDYGCLD